MCLVTTAVQRRQGLQGYLLSEHLKCQQVLMHYGLQANSDSQLLAVRIQQQTAGHVTRCWLGRCICDCTSHRLWHAGVLAAELATGNCTSDLG